MRSLVTGGAGFIGSNLIDALLAAGDEVLAIDDLSTGRRENLLAAGAARLEVGDIRDADLVERHVTGFRPDRLIHLAAQADVRRAVADPAFDAEVNVLGTINVLEAARAAGKVPVVFAATGGVVYGEGEGAKLPFKETARPAPETAYGASKLAGEAYVELYRRLHGMPGVALRFGNVYGPRQDPHGEAGVVAIFCGRLLAGEQPTIFGDGRQTRDYVHVSDAVGAILGAADALLERGDGFGGPLNVGTGRETSVLDLLGYLLPLAAADLEPVHAPPREGEIQRVAIDPAAIRSALGWEAEVPLSEGLRATFESIRDRG